ncbi:hypothetical protein [Roseivirga echinicomitans]|uniref:Tetratricopeptide repeat protein n=1 Tax=Roseivirga echinicomitans TaxID=296218 RepID=A0A150X081_9BACT|nr:hypothetical protein [Roseivirga echinicomitans]KYG71952.1 hypothetical protein AWN68_12275 [Roseivirga echinicomitans]
MKKLIFCLLLGLFAFPGLAQNPEIIYPDDPKMAGKAKEKFAMSLDDMSLERYREAANSLAWLLKNAPDLYEGLYINSYKAYEGIAEKETDPAKKRVYLDSMFTVYKLKDERFPLSDTEINNVAYRYYKYHKDDADKYDEALKAFARAYENPDEVINNNLVAYMDIVRRSHIKKKNITEDQVLDIHSKITEIIEKRIAEGQDEPKFEQYKTIVDQALTSIIDVNCDFIQQKLYPQLKENPTNVKLAKRIFQLSLTAKCSDSKFFMEAVEVVHNAEPTAGLAGIIGRKKLISEQYPEAIKYLQEAVSLEQDKAKKAETTLSLAKAYALSGEKGKARNEAIKAAELDKSVTEGAYNLVATLYMGSFEDCKQNVSQVSDRAVFFAAYDAYKKAGNAKGMESAKAQFPTKTEVFEQNLEEGASIKVGCWINVTSTIRTRPIE